MDHVILLVFHCSKQFRFLLSHEFQTSVHLHVAFRRFLVRRALKRCRTMDEKKKTPLLAEGDRLSTDFLSIRALWRTDVFPFLPARYVLAIMGFLGFFNVYALRVNLFMTIVAMVNESADPSSNLVRAHCVRILFFCLQFISFLVRL